MAKLVDAPDLKSDAERRAGSIPVPGTIVVFLGETNLDGKRSGNERAHGNKSRQCIRVDELRVLHGALRQGNIYRDVGEGPREWGALETRPIQLVKLTLSEASIHCGSYSLWFRLRVLRYLKELLYVGVKTHKRPK